MKAKDGAGSATLSMVIIFADTVLLFLLHYHSHFKLRRRVECPWLPDTRITYSSSIFPDFNSPECGILSNYLQLEMMNFSANAMSRVVCLHIAPYVHRCSFVHLLSRHSYCKSSAFAVLSHLQRPCRARY